MTMVSSHNNFPIPSLSGSEAPACRGKREAALKRFQVEGLPSTRLESWRYTSLKAISGLTFHTPDPRSALTESHFVGHALFDGGASYRRVIVNGLPLATEGSLPAGLTVTLLSSALGNTEVTSRLGSLLATDDSSLSALNLASFQEGLFIHVSKGVVVDKPLELLFVSDPCSGVIPIVSYSRLLIVLEAGSKLQIVESSSSVSETSYFTNGVSEIFLGENSVLDHVKVQSEAAKAFHLSQTKVSQSRDSRFDSHLFTLGSGLSRSEISSTLLGEGADCRMNGLFIGNADRHLDHFTVVDHAVPHTSSEELYKGILDDKSTGVFQGKVVVRKDAQKTDAKQTNRNLLLSTDAHVNTKPQLEILANDVKCTHGAAIGRIEAEALFYLRSRGIDVETSKHMLTVAFASEMVGRLNNESLRRALTQKVEASLEQSAARKGLSS